MSKHNNRSKKWKSSLLQSSLPLETVVEGILRDHGLYVFGEFPYLRQKEDTIEAEFSVDIWARSQFVDKSQFTTNILVECKYVTPGASWLFSPQPALVGQETSDLRPQLLTIIEETSNLLVGPEGWDRLNSFGVGFSFASKGVTIHEQHIERDLIRHGLYQMRFALPNLVAADMRIRTNPIFRVFQRRVAVICGILVTTAPIRILNADAGFKDYLNASRLEDISAQTDGVIVSQFFSPELVKYCRMLCADLRNEGPAWSQLVEWRAKLIKDEQNQQQIDQLLEYRFLESTQRIAIIHLDSLSGFLKNLIETVESTESHINFLE
jgi:hypothetical protein